MFTPTRLPNKIYVNLRQILVNYFFLFYNMFMNDGRSEQYPMEASAVTASLDEAFRLAGTLSDASERLKMQASLGKVAGEMALFFATNQMPETTGSHDDREIISAIAEDLLKGFNLDPAERMVVDALVRNYGQPRTSRQLAGEMDDSEFRSWSRMFYTFRDATRRFPFGKCIVASKGSRNARNYHLEFPHELMTLYEEKLGSANRQPPETVDVPLISEACHTCSIEVIHRLLKFEYGNKIPPEAVSSAERFIESELRTDTTCGVENNENCPRFDSIPAAIAALASSGVFARENEE